MSVAKELLDLVETIVPTLKAEAAEQYEWGFDLTSISAENWKKILKENGMHQGPINDSQLGAWVWTGPGIKIHTGNDPIKGTYAQGGKREDEVGYASYIGVYGDKDKVTKVSKMISELADDIKEENPGDSRYI
jgi:hypothetical protein